MQTPIPPSSLQTFRLRVRLGWILLKSRLSTMIQQMIESTSRPSEPTIRKAQGPDGLSGWEIYNPFNQTTHWYASEEAVRYWIEQHYYRL